MNTFLSVKEAAKLAGKSSSSIRRIIYPILEDDQHADRPHIQPSPDEVKALRLKGESFAWKVSEDLLRRAVPDGPAQSTSEAKPATGDGTDQSAAIIEMLRKELEIKNQQIATQTDLLKGLSERLREGNILMGTLQKQLTLGEGTTRANDGVVDVSTTAAKTEKGSQSSAPSPQKRDSFFQRLFR